MITGYFITAEQYLNKNRKAYKEMKVFLSAFGLLSKVKAAKLASHRWCLSSDIPTGKCEKTDRANDFYMSETRTSDNFDQYGMQQQTTTSDLRV